MTGVTGTTAPVLSARVNPSVTCQHAVRAALNGRSNAPDRPEADPVWPKARTFARSRWTGAFVPTHKSYGESRSCSK
jgi:hypothetical protein